MCQCFVICSMLATFSSSALHQQLSEGVWLCCLHRGVFVWICRVWEGAPHVEVEWTVGPIPINDDLGACVGVPAIIVLQIGTTSAYAPQCRLHSTTFLYLVD